MTLSGQVIQEQERGGAMDTQLEGEIVNRGKEGALQKTHLGLHSFLILTQLSEQRQIISLFDLISSSGDWKNGRNNMELLHN